MTLSSTISRPPRNAMGESNLAARRPISAAARTLAADPGADDFLLPLLDVARRINSYADSVARAHGLTQSQLIVIARLERQPHLSLAELAALAGVTEAALARLVDDLATRGMVECCPDAADRRTSLRLRPAAAPLLRDIELLRVNLQRVAATGIDPAVLKTMVAGLRRTDELFRGVDHIAFA